MQPPQESGRALSAMLIQILTTRRRRRQAPPVPPPPPPPQQPKSYVVHGVHLPVQVQLGPTITTCGT